MRKKRATPINIESGSLQGIAVRKGYVIVKSVHCEDILLDWAETETEAEHKARMYIEGSNNGDD